MLITPVSSFLGNGSAEELSSSWDAVAPATVAASRQAADAWIKPAAIRRLASQPAARGTQQIISRELSRKTPTTITILTESSCMAWSTVATGKVSENRKPCRSANDPTVS